jgi:hypothetical protein
MLVKDIASFNEKRKKGRRYLWEHYQNSVFRPLDRVSGERITT